MHHFYIIPNYSKQRAASTAGIIHSFLTEHGAVCMVDPKSEAPEQYTDPSRIPLDTECVIVLGGDGTVIQAVHDLGNRSIPLIGINLGHIGYLAEADEDKLFSTLTRLINDDFFIEERMTIEGQVIRSGEVIGHERAFNDIILTRRLVSKMANFSLYVDGRFLNRYAADGIIVATPTGSTAYSLAAGGPIVMPGSFLFVITPICPHAVSSARSIVLPKESVIELVVEQRSESVPSHEILNYDAHTTVELAPEDRIRITCSQENVRMIRLTSSSFLETLRKKISQ